MRTRLFLLVPTLLAGVLALEASPAAALTTHTVTTTDDVVDGGDGVVSLREAFTLANTDGDDSVIALALSVTYSLTLCDAGSPQELANASGDLNLDNDGGSVTIDGGGSTIDQTCADERVIEAGTTLTVNSTTVSGGDLESVADGGGITGNVLTLTDSTVSDNTAILGGGVLASDLTLLRTTVHGNTASTAGGIAVTGLASLTATDSSVTGNHATVSIGGIRVENAASATVLTNTTVGGNTKPSSASSLGTQVDTAGALTLVHTTVVGTTIGAALRAVTSLTTFGSVVDRVGGFSACAAGQGPTTSLGYNVVTDTSCGFTGPTDAQDVADVGLGTLADNGGAGFTFLPDAGGFVDDRIPAVDCDGAVVTDARGVARPQGNGCEPGAIEREADFGTDLHIRNASQATFGGGDVINLTGAGQSRLQSKARGQKATFFVRFQNDGDVVDDITVKGPGTGGGFTVRYFSGTTNLTAAVVAGTHVLQDVAPGATRTIKVEVTVGQGPRNVTRNLLVKGTSVGAPTERDVVKASVKRL